MSRVETVELIGGAKVSVDFEESRVKCRGCDKWIRFGITQVSRRFIPIIDVGEKWQAHFADCEKAKEFRKK